MTTTNVLIPVWISVTYAQYCECHADLRISASNDSDLDISVIHQAITATTTYELAGNASIDHLQVQDGDVLIVQVRHDSELIASGEFQVSLPLIGRLDAVLIPRLVRDLLFDQCSQSMLDRAIARALATLRSADTDELVQPETAQVL